MRTWYWKRSDVIILGNISQTLYNLGLDDDGYFTGHYTISDSIHHLIRAIKYDRISICMSHYKFNLIPKLKYSYYIWEFRVFGIDVAWWI